MAGTFPSTPGFKSVSGEKRYYNLSSESLNGRVQVRSLGATRREYTLEFPPMTRAQFSPIYAFIDSQEGSLGTFQITLPDPANPTVDVTITARLTGDVQSYDYGVDNLVSYELDIIEVV